jgi:hypothetical protein
MASRKRSTPSLRNKDRGARASWGGKRKGAGRKPELTESTGREIVSWYLTYKRQGLDRQSAICKLMAVFGVTHRMVVRCLNEFLAAAKPDADLFGYAVKGMNDNEIKDLPKEENEIRKLKPGKYQDRDLNLRLVVNDAGERRWTFCFFWMGAEFRELVLGESTMGLENARQFAIKARRTLVKGQNPIDDSWGNAVVEGVKSKS